MEYEDQDTAEHAPKPVSGMDDAQLYLTLKQWFLYDDDHSKNWRSEAKVCFDFVACDQWEDTARKAHTDTNRVPLTFNYTLSFIKAVCGLEINSRHETVYLPRNIEEGDIIANESLSDVSKWMGDNCDAEDEQSEAFMDTTICGMGWTESRMDWEMSRDGMYVEEKLDPLEMRWDRSARKKNLQDSRRMWRVRTMTLEEAMALFPDAEPGDLNAAWAMGYDAGEKVQSVEERRLKLENSVPNDPKCEVSIVQVQWVEREAFYRVADPTTGQEVEMDEAEFKRVQRNMKARNRTKAKKGLPEEQLVHAKQYRKRYRQAFLGSTILEKGDCPDPERFTLQCITGQLHKTKGTWFGLVTLMKDPQMNANKWLSQALHILNTTAKGGVIAERTAFKNVAEAQKTWAAPDAITIVEDGAIKNGKIMQKPGVGLAGPYIEMMKFAIQAIPDVTGINLELMGMRDAQQAGILEAQRKQAGMTILATLMDALRRYRKNVGRIRLTFIQKYLPDGQIIRINGPDGYRAMRFLRDQHLGEYDVIVSDAPTSPNQKEATWAMLMQLSQLPQFQALMTPDVATEALNYCPLPSKIVQMFKKALVQPKPEQEEQKQIGRAMAQAELDEKVAGATKDKASAALDQAKTVLTLADAGVKHMEAANQKLAAAVLGRGRMGPQFGAMIPNPAAMAQDAIQPVQFGGMKTLPMPQELPMGPAEDEGFVPPPGMAPDMGIGAPI